MAELTEALRRLREDDPDVALILDVYPEMERVFHGSLEAMGYSTGKQPVDVANSAEVAVSFCRSPSTADD